MRTSILRVTVPAMAAVGVLALGIAPAAQASGGSITALTTFMTGAKEVPGPGDPDGSGVFAAVVTRDKLCYTMVVNRIDPATAAHIHDGNRTQAGPIVVALKPPNRTSSACIRAVPDDQNSAETLTRSELAAIVADPAEFYVNVHNGPFPAGAVRGQLR